MLVRRKEWTELCRHVTVMNTEQGELRDVYKSMHDDLCQFVKDNEKKHVDIEKALIEIVTRLNWLDRLVWAIISISLLSLLADMLTRFLK